MNTLVSKTMRHLYSILFYLILPFVFIRLWTKSRNNPIYLQGWKQRLGWLNLPLSAQRGIWVHAVSVGEMIAARPLIQALQARYPHIPIVITNMTPTGLALAKQLNKERLHAVYVPYDLPGSIQQFLNHVCPKLVIIMETELWPNMIHHTAQRKIPIVLANARLSLKSAKNYSHISWMVRPMLQQINLILVQTHDEAERFIRLGANPKHIQVTGSIKFDTPVPEELTKQGFAMRINWQTKDRPTFIAASTHRGEEEQILNAFRELQKSWPKALLILVPRHQERFEQVAALCAKMGFTFIRRSQKLPCTASTEIYLGDSLGELFLYYALADVAFVGGSLVPTGGHNLLEPAAMGLPLISGSHLFNFKEIFKLLNDRQAIIIINTTEELTQTVTHLWSNPSLCQQMSHHAREVVQENKGALSKQVEFISKWL